jgi:hypothetical protein
MIPNEQGRWREVSDNWQVYASGRSTSNEFERAIEPGEIKTRKKGKRDVLIVYLYIYLDCRVSEILILPRLNFRWDRSKIGMHATYR